MRISTVILAVVLCAACGGSSPPKANVFDGSADASDPGSSSAVDSGTVIHHKVSKPTTNHDAGTVTLLPMNDDAGELVADAGTDAALLEPADSGTDSAMPDVDAGADAGTVTTDTDASTATADAGTDAGVPPGNCGSTEMCSTTSIGRVCTPKGVAVPNHCLAVGFPCGDSSGLCDDLPSIGKYCIKTCK